MTEDQAERYRELTARFKKKKNEFREKAIEELKLEFPNCLGYPDCDGDLEGEEHSDLCPRKGRPPIDYAGVLVNERAELLTLWQDYREITENARDLANEVTDLRQRLEGKTAESDAQKLRLDRHEKDTVALLKEVTGLKQWNRKLLEALEVSEHLGWQKAHGLRQCGHPRAFYQKIDLISDYPEAGGPPPEFHCGICLVEESNRTLRQGLETLVNRVREIGDSASLKSVFTIAFTHGVQYDGPNWAQELADAERLLNNGTK